MGRVLAQPLDHGLVTALRPEDRQIVGTAPSGGGQGLPQLCQVDREGDPDVLHHDPRQCRDPAAHTVGQREQDADALIPDPLLSAAADPGRVVRREGIEVFAVTDAGPAAQPVQQPADASWVERLAEGLGGRPDGPQELLDDGGVGELLPLREPAVEEPPADGLRRFGAPASALDQEVVSLGEHLEGGPQRRRCGDPAEPARFDGRCERGRQTEALHTMEERHEHQQGRLGRIEVQRPPGVGLAEQPLHGFGEARHEAVVPPGVGSRPRLRRLADSRQRGDGLGDVLPEEAGVAPGRDVLPHGGVPGRLDPRVGRGRGQAVGTAVEVDGFRLDQGAHCGPPHPVPRPVLPHPPPLTPPRRWSSAGARSPRAARIGRERSRR